MPDLISRRELLKRGAKYGGAAVFATPIINVLSMAEAGATTVHDYGHDPDNGDHHHRRRRRREWDR